MTDFKKKYHERKLEEARNAAIAQQRADIDYIAMMCDIDIDGTEAEVMDNE